MTLAFGYKYILFEKVTLVLLNIIMQLYNYKSILIEYKYSFNTQHCSYLYLWLQAGKTFLELVVWNMNNYNNSYAFLRSIKQIVKFNYFC